MITGRQNSGKSKYYEKILECEENRLYFATLWESDDTYSKIEHHQKRRDGNWVFGKSFGDIERDRLTIAQLVLTLDSPRYCMIDGLTNWCVYCSNVNQMYIEEANRLVLMLVELINSFDNVIWYLLDNMRDDYSKVPILARAWEVIHSKLKSDIEDIQVIEWRR